MPISELHVFWNMDHVGVLTARQNGRVRFAYSPEWLTQPALPVSISLPCQPEIFDADVSTHFFENYIPEGKIKTELASARHIASHDIFSFLLEFGRDMAGALSIQKGIDLDAPSEYEDITDRLEELLSKRDTQSPLNLFLLLDANLSLAGGQDKLPVLYQDGRFFLSRGCNPTSHIIKPMHTIFRDLPYNEHFCMSLAKAVGLNVQKTEIIDLGGTPVYMIERFDRSVQNGRLIRLHQEDFCQALSIPAIQKYQIRGGPGWPELMKVLEENPFINRSHEINALVNIAIYNCIIGNTDAHGKNFSIFHRREGHVSLTPFYDLCSIYPYKDIIKHNRMAMSIGGKQRFDKLDEDNWRKFAEIVCLSEEEMSEKMTSVANAIENGTHSVLETHKELYGKTDIPKIISEQAMRYAEEMKTMAERICDVQSPSP